MRYGGRAMTPRPNSWVHILDLDQPGRVVGASRSGFGILPPVWTLTIAVGDGVLVKRLGSQVEMTDEPVRMAPALRVVAGTDYEVTR